jgi:uncharacterized protein YndB with AHSA1/START domain
MEKEKFVYSLYINAAPEKVWSALTESEFTRQYWGGRTVESDWKEGSPVKIVQPQGDRVMNFEGKIIQCDPPKMLSYTFNVERGDLVTFELKQVAPEETRLTIIHEGFDEHMKNMFIEGWYAIMSSLKTLLETGKALDHSWWKG